MQTERFAVSAMSAALAMALSLPALAQNGPTSRTGPDYSSGVASGDVSETTNDTPEADGRPGVYYFNLGSEAARKHDYQHAVEMFKVSASWAYKPAEYNLGLIYFRGEGVPMNRARGAAWMILAAERGNKSYARARDIMVTMLSDGDFKRADAIWNELKPTYGDAIALHRAKLQWAYVRNNKTGTHVGGGVGELKVGALDKSHGSNKAAFTNASQATQGGSADGAIAYQEFQQSDNPYDPAFVKNRTGSTTVGPLVPVKPADSKASGQPDNGGNDP